jgi:hypothetical protein
MHKLAPNNIMHPARSIDTENQQWISRAGDDERSKDAISLEGVDKAAFRCRAGVLYEAADSVRD